MDARTLRNVFSGSFAIVGVMGAAGSSAADVAFKEHLIFTDYWAWASESAIVADVNGDGRPDVVSCTRMSGDMWWFENHGGTSPSFTVHPLTNHPDCRAVYAGDLDGDGDIDLLSASPGTGVRWHQNNGGQTPTFAVRSVPTTGSDFFGVSAADINHDGKLDIVTANGPGGTSANQVAWYENKGGTSPTFVEHEISRLYGWAEGLRLTDS